MTIDWKDYPPVETVPGKLNRRPVVTHSRAAADTLVECAELGESAEEIAFNYDLRPDDVRRILAYAAQHCSGPTNSA